MPLSPEELRALSRLLDQALELPRAELPAWLAALPAELQALRPALREMLARRDAQGEGSGLISSLPRLPGVPDEPGAAPVQPGQRVGAYRLLHEIGRGGMGSVWLAERDDGIFQRQVALKLPRLDKSPRLAERMARERQIGALLEHPHIARLYDAGIDTEGRPYLVLERVQGLSLLEHAQAQRLGPPACLQLMLQACAAVAHAHRHLVVHRDIKPANLMVDEAGQVKLLDFGIARLLDAEDGSAGKDDSPRTHTPSYAAPEQLQGGAVTTATDIYSLGVVLHELLTGRLPNDAANPARRLGPDLAAVLRCALQPDPAARYGTVVQLADDLRRVLSRRPVQAAPAPWWHRLRLFTRRHRPALAASAAAVLLLAGSAALLLQQRGRELAQEQRATLSREFLAHLLEDAEPAAGAGMAEVTGVQMVHSALARARSAFASQPVLSGQMLTELGFMLRRLQQPRQALQVLQEAHALLLRAAEPDDPALHVAKGQLAIQWTEDTAAATRSASMARATQLAHEVLAGCPAARERCAKPRAYAHGVLRLAAGLRADRAPELWHARQVVAATERAFGSGHAELANVLVTLGRVCRNQGLLVEAGQALQRARAVAAGTVLRADDAASLRLVSALVHGDLGQLQEAHQGFRALLAEPAPPARRAAQQRHLAGVLLAQGLLPQALQAAEAAVALARQAAAEGEAAFALQARGRVLSALGRHEAADADLAAVRAALAGLGYPAAGLEQLRARRLAAEMALRAGREDQALALLRDLPAQHRRPPPAAVLGPLDLAQVLDLQGTLARRQGQPAAAVALHGQAQVLLAELLPEQHPLRVRNELARQLAAWLAAGAAGDRGALQRAAARYGSAWPEGSAWRLIPDVQVAQVAAWQQVIP